ncbi:MAG: hypothetical protein ACTHQ3_15725 [Motilibacteraceae bacterium]
MAAEAWVTRAEGTTVRTAEAWVTEVDGLAGNLPAAWVSRIRGSSISAAAALIVDVRGLADKSANAPAIVAGPDKTWPAGSKIWLTCSAVPKTGATIASYTWRVVSKSANAGLVVYDQGNGVREPSFRAPLRRRQATYTFGVVATDSLGRVSDEATTTVTVEQAEILVATGNGWQPAATGYAVAGRWT